MQIANVDLCRDQGIALPRRFGFSSLVLHELLIGLDSLVILSVGLVTYLAPVGAQGGDPGYYAAAISFVIVFGIATPLDESCWIVSGPCGHFLSVRSGLI